MRKIILVLIICFSSNSLYSQGEFNNWYFGEMSGITFNTPNRNPVFLRGNPIFQYEGSATISDAMGNLLFSTNGEQIYNYKGSKLNAEKLMGHQSSTQSALIAKKPGSSSIYYVFTSDASEYVDPPNAGIHYSIVDMAANGGNGAMIMTNVPLLPKASEKLNATLHANKKDIWVVTKGWKNNNIYSFLLTENGIEDTVITSIGFNPTNDYNSVGQLKISPQGTKIAIAYQDVTFFEIYKFDNKTGVPSEPLKINIAEVYNLYGVEFSSSGKLLYISNSRNGFNTGTLFQYDISIHDTTSIRKSEYIVSKGGHIGSLQMAPNGNIYIAKAGEYYLSAIRNPDSKGAACGFRVMGVALDSSKSQLGLPNAIPLGSNYSLLIDVCVNNDFSLDPLDILQDTSKYVFEFGWTGPNGFTSKETNPYFTDATLADSGLYVLTVKYIVNGEEFVVSVQNHVRVNARTQFKILGLTEFCKGEATSLSADTIHPFFSYRWSTGSNASQITVKDSGTYFLSIRNSRGCYDTAFIHITVLETPKAEIKGTGLICDDNSEVLLESVHNKANYSYLWSTGETTQTIKVKLPGKYGLRVTNIHGCSDTTTYTVHSIDDLQVVIEGDSVICVPGIATLTARSLTDLSEYIHYFVWSTGDTSNTIIATKAGTYEVKLVVAGTCFAYASRTLERNQAAFLEMSHEDDIHICRGDTVTVFVINPNDTYTYRWSDGVVGFERKFYNEEGKFTLYAITPEGCSDSAWVNIIIHNKPFVQLNFEDEISICDSQTLIIHAFPKNPDFEYLWSTGETTDSIIVNKTGLYYVTVTTEFGCSDFKAVSVIVSDKLPVRIGGPKMACQGDTITLVANANFPDSESNFTYLWSTGETSKSIKVTETGEVWVSISHSEGCEGTDTISALFFEIPTVKILNPSPIAFCIGGSVELNVLNPNPEFVYTWNDGTLGTTLIVKVSGVYKVYVANGNICIDSAEIEVLVHDSPISEINVIGETFFCVGGSVLLESTIAPETDYIWSTGEKSPSITVAQSGKYWLAVWNQWGCSDTAFVEIEELPELDVELTTDKPELCIGETVSISTTEEYSRYEWSTGETTRTILVSKAGNYTVTVYDENDCRATNSIEIFNADESMPLTFRQLTFPEPCIGEEAIIEIEVTNPNPRFIVTKDFTFGNTMDMELVDSGNIMAGMDANSKRKIKIRYLPTTTDELVGLIQINCLGPCEFFSSFEFIVASFMKTELTSPELVFTGGEEACIDFVIEPKCDISEDLNSGFEITISFDAQYFLPKTVNLGTILGNYIKDGRRFIKIYTDIYTIKQNKQNLVTICGTILLGADLKSSIIIEDFEWDNVRIANESNNGTLVNISCVQEIRGIRYYTPTTLKVNPMPASDNLRVLVNSGSIGEFELVLVSYDGSQEILKKWENTQTSMLEFEFDISTKSQGVYSILLKAPWSLHYEKIMVVR
ncbi:MAG: hypothetical protein IAE98_08695 [Candidatus Kapabacteria bacterium]|nr:hypothetical protein [Candidatus Kapabacteria bacterium]